MTRFIAYIPVDGRPVTRDLPQQLAFIGGWEVCVPKREDLGFLKKPGDVNDLQLWLKHKAPDVEGFVLSIDMLGYGGLVPSRVTTEDTDVIHSRLAILRELKRQYPTKPIMAFSSTMRISNSNVNEEEKTYWAQYGPDIWAYSYHSHRYEKTQDEQSLTIVEELSRRIPNEILEDYKRTRERHFAINLTLLDLVEEGVIDHLVYPQDDTAEFGWNIREQERLADRVNQRKLFNQVQIYPGADEVGSVLVARILYEREGVDKPTYSPFYSGEKGALSTAMYEDRPIETSVKGQIAAFGSHTVDPSTADILLAVNVPGKKQGDLALQLHLTDVDTNERHIGEWLSRIRYYLSRGRRVALADLAYANGADPVLMPRVLADSVFHRLEAFAAWNTAGNTLGTVVAMSAMNVLRQMKSQQQSLLESHRMSEYQGVSQQQGVSESQRMLEQQERPEQQETTGRKEMQERQTMSDGNIHVGTLEEYQRRHRQQLLLRLLDDYLYQSVVRQVVRETIDETTIDKAQLRDHVSQTFIVHFDQLKQQEGVKQLLSSDEVKGLKIHLPWQRTFEIGLQFHLSHTTTTTLKGGDSPGK
ncbi:DUF4127 family protein [Caldalkalibacillus salinus]|uniref:DUF4127 family protein n=1 Tax=Caldalkalibacillus salinus TaxID=2803787 RepID=UPI00192363C0|nr:DUF4127 family protein [Caldalkalibacillus salinus]